jgi:hypothetical protein
MTFPNLTNPAPKLGNLRCAWQDTSYSPPHGIPATWHIAWWLKPKADFSLVCDEHMATAQRDLVFFDRHPVTAECDMPGTGWLTSSPSRCVPATTEDVGVERSAQKEQR